jgi:hypothetical protein
MWCFKKKEEGYGKAGEDSREFANVIVVFVC